MRAGRENKPPLIDIGRSASRPNQFARTLEVLRDACGPQRLITFARAVSTPEETVVTVTLAQARPDMADRRTVVLVGNSATRRVGRHVYTPRRYATGVTE